MNFWTWAAVFAAQGAKQALNLLVFIVSLLVIVTFGVVGTALEWLVAGCWWCVDRCDGAMSWVDSREWDTQKAGD